MVVTGELIRMMNYVDDIAATLRRVQIGIHEMSSEERKRLADYMRSSDPNFNALLAELETGRSVREAAPTSAVAIAVVTIIGAGGAGRGICLPRPRGGL